MKKIITLLFIAGIIASCNNMNKNAENGSMNNMNTNSAGNEARMQQFYDQVINAHNVAMLDSFTTADFVDHSPSPGHSGKGIADVKESFQQWFTADPDVHVKTNWIVSRGDTIIAHVTLTGTNTGAMGSMPATGKSYNIDGVDIVTIKDGKATDRWGYFEDMKMMQQLGMMPEAGKMESGTDKAVQEQMEKMKTEDKKVEKTTTKKK